MRMFQFKWTAAFAVWFFATITVVAANIYYTIPSPETIKGCFVTRMHGVELCPKGKGYVPLSQISSHVKNAVRVSEDTGFFNHNGFELEELKESFRTNLARGAFARGGSTITQQLARNMFLSSEKSLLRKVKEAIITYKLEETLTKNEILERYLNIVEFGKDIYGVGAAARHYFQKSPADLNALEASYLAFLLPSPVKYSASYYKGHLTKFGFQRIHQILFRLMSYHHLTPEEYAVAKDAIRQFPWKGTDLSVARVPTPDEILEGSEGAEQEAPTDEELGVDLTSPLGDEEDPDAI